MTREATIARESASHCEAKLHAFRKTQDGVVVSFVLHPSEISPSLQLAPLGTRYVLAFVEVGDDEKPKEVMPSDNRKQISRAPTETLPAPELADPSRARAPRTWDQITLAQQAGIRCNEKTFVAFLAARYRQTVDSTESASQLVRELCEVPSRSDIRPGTKSGNTWISIEQKYQTWLLAEKLGAA